MTTFNRNGEQEENEKEKITFYFKDQFFEAMTSERKTIGRAGSEDPSQPSIFILDDERARPDFDSQ